MIKILYKTKFNIHFARSSYLLPDVSADRIYRELWWTNLESFSVDVIPLWSFMLIYHLGMINRPIGGSSSETQSQPIDMMMIKLWNDISLQQSSKWIFHKHTPLQRCTLFTAENMSLSEMRNKELRSLSKQCVYSRATTRKNELAQYTVSWYTQSGGLLT
jgi:hypothetical protein